ncbi:MAG: NACHT domain-containing protein [Kiritimatiellae bacterium]|nr:NACHT domain-containing protein [Kiritimatiellia bacterium]
MPLTSNTPPKSGYDLAAKILETHPQDAIETMLKYSNGAESDWLEFKAGMKLLPEDEKKGDKPDDLYWDYVLSIVAMANTRGGAFVIGVNDKTHKAVPLSSCDPRHVLEEEGTEGYLRKEVLNRIDPRERKWTTKDGTIWSLDASIAPQLEGRFIPFDGTDVIVLLVKPIESGHELFVSQRIKSGDVFESLPYRRLGEAGEVKRHTKRADIENYPRTREVLTSRFGSICAELDAESSAGREDAELDDAIRVYYADLEKKTRQRLQAFVPLDAAGDEGSDEEEEPEFEDPTAISVFDEDDEPIKGAEGTKSSEDADSSTQDDDDSDESDQDDESDEDDEPKEPKTIRMGLSELLCQYDRVVLSGEPGAGKTTCLAHFAVERGKKQGNKPHLFAFIQLGRWAAGGSVLGLVGKACGLTLAQIETLLEDNRLHLVLDALNECPDHLRPAALENIRVLIREHPDLPVVLSSRKAEGLHLSGFPVFEVQAMDRDRQRQFLERHLHNADKALAILEALEKQPGGASIAQNPMLLRMVVDVVRDSESLPVGRATLYRAWLEKWYAREEKKARQAKDALPWTAEEAMRLLARLAFAGRAQGYRDIPIDLARQSLDGVDEAFLDRLCQGPLLDIEEDFVHFRHETFQEYLCAEWLLAEPTALDTLPEKDYDTWGMPIAYAAELRLPAKLPDELSEVVWEMNPWIAALATASLSPKIDALETSPELLLSKAIYSGEYLLSDSLREAFRAVFEKGQLFKLRKASFTYFIHLTNELQGKWLNFECACVINMPLIVIGNYSLFSRGIIHSFITKCRSKVDNLLILSHESMIEKGGRYFPDLVGYFALRWCLWNSKTIKPFVLLQNLIKLCKDKPYLCPLPIDGMQIFLQKSVAQGQWNRQIQHFEYIFGEDFIEKTLRSIHFNPRLWTQPGIIAFLRFAKKKEFAIYEASKSLLTYALNSLECFCVSPSKDAVDNIYQLCTLLDNSDVSNLLPTLSPFGIAVLKRVGFNPDGLCEPFFAQLPIASKEPLRKEDLEDVEKRRKILTFLLTQKFIMEVVNIDKHHYTTKARSNGKHVTFDIVHRVFFRNESFSEGVIWKNPKKRNFVLGSLWMVHVSIAKTNNDYRYRVDFATPVSGKERFEIYDSKCNAKNPGADTPPEISSPSSTAFPTEETTHSTNAGLRAFSRLISSAKDKLLSTIPSFEQNDKFPKDDMATQLDDSARINAENKKDETENTGDDAMRTDNSEENSQNARFDERLLSENSYRNKVERQVTGRVFGFVVVNILNHGAMLTSSEFAEPVFCHKSVCPEIMKSSGAQVDAEVTLRYQAKTNMWGFAIKKVLSISGVPYSGPTSDIKNSTVNREYQNEVTQNSQNSETKDGGISASTPPVKSPKASRIYLKTDLVDESSRLQIERKLKGVRWEMKVHFLSENRSYVLFSHPSFPDNVYCPISSTLYRDVFQVGQVWKGKVRIGQNKKGSFYFVARGVKPVSCVPGNELQSQNPARRANPSPAARLPLKSKVVLPTPSKASFAVIPSTIHIYIDEAWPGTIDEAKKDIGVIAGIVWMGDEPDYDVLPKIATHLHSSGRSELQTLLLCKQAFPFAFPIRFTATFNPNVGKYLNLFRDAIVVLLGWVLPRPNRLTKVFIHAEHFDTLWDGTNETDHFRALLAGVSMMQNSNRLTQWSIEKVEWQDKPFEYIPYGDLVGYLFVGTSKGNKMAKEFQVERWPGCVPFSENLLPVLRDLDAADATSAAGSLFFLSQLCGGSQLFRHSLQSILDSAKRQPELRNAILRRLCEEYEKKDRDLRRIERIADAFFETFPDEMFANQPRLRFLRLLAALQQANHDGNPAAGDAAFRLYDGLRADMLKRDLELCAYGDLNVAVHFNDRFEFGKAEALLRQCREAPSFQSFRNRGRLLSSLGQSAALQGRYAEADDLFREALDAFSELGAESAEEVDQTRVYRAFAALDAKHPERLALVEAALGAPLSEAAGRWEAVVGYPYHEHLLVKTLWMLILDDDPSASKWVSSYLSTSARWGESRQHPWELILLYRGLLAWKTDRTLANQCFEEWDEWFKSVPHGGTLSLIQGFGLVAMKRHCGRQVDQSQLESLLAPVAKALPNTAETVDALLRIALDTSPDSITKLWTLLPFNYC